MRAYSTLSAAILASALFLGSGIATATPIAPDNVATFDITSDHCGGGGCLGGVSGGTITVTQNADGSLSFDVDLADNLQFIDGGFEAGFGFNLIGNPTITYTGVTTGFDPVANPETAGSLHMDGTGFFEYGLNCGGCGPGGSAPLAGPLDFTISATGGLTLSSLAQNANGQFFAIDVINTDTNRTGGVDASTGTIPPQPDTPAPEPSVLALLGIALFGLSATARRRRKS